MSTTASKPLNVVILAAGKGERFLAEGVTVPKPLIEWKGRSLLGHSIDVALTLADATGHVVVVATDQVASEAHRALRGGQLGRVVAVSVTQPGPVASAMLALAHLPPDEPVAFMDCDNYYASMQWVRKARALAGEPFITVAKLRPGMVRTDYCNVGVHEGGGVYDIVEKGVMSGDAKLATGVYGFPSAGAFGRVGHEILRGIDEPPMSMALFDMVGLQAIEVEGWQPLGTPAQLASAK
jgi:molybdopterin-guanine dinucleotide biosynthesis protein A